MRGSRWWVLLVTTIALVACSTLAVLPTATRDRPPTVLVANRSMEALRVYDEVRLLGTIYPGETECIIIHRESTRNLRFRQLTSTAMGPDFDPFSLAGWAVTIRNVLWMDVLSLQPAEACT